MTRPDDARTKKSFTTLTPVSRLVRPIVKSLLPKNAVMLQQLFEAWPDLVKGTEAEGTFLDKLTFPRGQQAKGQLSLFALTSAQAMEVTFSQKALLHRVNAFFGSEAVAELRVTAYPTSMSAAKESVPPKVNHAPPRSCQSLDKMVVGISNPSLRAALVELGSLVITTDTDEDEHA